MPASTPLPMLQEVRSFCELQGCMALKELRLNHNALAELPQSLSACRQLRIVDLAGNPIVTLKPIKASWHPSVMIESHDII